MKVAVISDIHDNGTKLIKAIEIIKKRKITEVIALGDFCYPGIIRYLVTTKLRVKCIFGNNDGDKFGLNQAALKSGGKVSFSRWEFDEYGIYGRKVWVQHHDEGALEMAMSGRFQTVFYGHDHKQFTEKLGNGCLLFNPGEICGLVTGTAGFGVWDPGRNEVEVVKILDPVIVTPFPERFLPSELIAQRGFLKKELTWVSY